MKGSSACSHFTRYLHPQRRGLSFINLPSTRTSCAKCRTKEEYVVSTLCYGAKRVGWFTKHPHRRQHFPSTGASVEPTSHLAHHPDRLCPLRPAIPIPNSLHFPIPFLMWSQALVTPLILCSPLIPITSLFVHPRFCPISSVDSGAG